jgi:hypothetical protein
MAEISSYPLKTPKSGDLITFSETYDANAANPVVGNPTKSATVGSINALAVNGTVGTIPVFTGSNIIGDSQLVQLGPVNGLYKIRFNNADRLIVNKPSSVTSGDPEFLVMQDDVAKVSMGWDDDGDGFGFLYNWAGNGWRFGSAGNNPELTIVTAAGQEGVTIANSLTVNSNIDTLGDYGYLINGYGWANEASGVLTLGDWDGSDFVTRIVDQNGTEVLRVTNGRVGIGNDNPQRELHVSGGVRITNVLDLFQGNDNTFAGTDAGNFKTVNIAGSFNTGFGKNSQAAQLNGNYNSSLGFNSLANSISGSNNTAIGTNSMTLLTVGSFNTGVGSNSLRKATGGQGNTAIGFSALGENKNSNYNTAVGHGSLSNITTGSRNTAVGIGAGKFISDGSTANSTGSNSIFIGSSAKANADNETNQIVIGVDAVGNGSNTTTIGSASTVSTEIKGNVGIGTASPSSAVEVAGGDIETSTSTNGLILKSPDGTRYRVTVANGGALTVSAV